MEESSLARFVLIEHITKMIYEVFDLMINLFLTENKTTEERRVVQQEEI